MTTFLKRAVVAASLVLAPLGASAAVIDFDALNAGPLQTVPLIQFTEDGYTFDLSFTTTGGARGPAIFDSTCAGRACNGDTDLTPLNQGDNGISGNVLILQEQLPSNTPDDDAQSGTITLTLVSGPAFYWTGASAIDDTTFTFSSSVDGLLGSIQIGPEGDVAGGTASTTFVSSLINVGQSITIGYGGSGAVDSLILAPVPLPAALPLMLAGMGGLAFAARRRRRNTV